MTDLDGSLRELQRLHGNWSDLYTGAIADEPLHIDHQLNVTTDW